MPVDDKAKLKCQKCSVENCEHCSGTKTKGTCSSITSLDFSGLYTGNIAHMNRLFYQCPKLTYIDFSSFNRTDNNLLLFDNNADSIGKMIIYNKDIYYKINHTILVKWKIVFKET